MHAPGDTPVSERAQKIFGLLVLTQAAHSIEEYVGRLWEVFPPARFLPSLVSDDLERGFLILSVGLVAFGVLCLLGPVRRRWPSASAIMWFWIVIETINGVVHPIWALRQGRYAPGVLTAPPLLILSLLLARQLSRR